MSEHKICTRCVMDTTDPNIHFDENGVCDYCQTYDKLIKPNWEANIDKIDELKVIADKIKKSRNRRSKYDCIIGMSGGADSSYLAYVAKEIMGLNPLIYTVDTGWNLNVAVENIEKIVKKLNLDMYTEVVDWTEMRDLQLAFFNSQVPYQDFPQDHAIFAGLYNYAAKNRIKYVLTGANFATEGIRPPMEWVYINDIRFMKHIHKKFGSIKLKTFPRCSMLRYRFVYPVLFGLKRFAPLNYVKYDKTKAEAFLESYFGWEKYANKHYENVFTRFYEGYYLVHKFGFDKRKTYLSNLVITNQITRDEALQKLQVDPYSKKQMQDDKAYIAKKLGLTTKSFDELIDGPNKTYRDYKNNYKYIAIMIKLAYFLGIEKKKFG